MVFCSLGTEVWYHMNTMEHNARYTCSFIQHYTVQYVIIVSTNAQAIFKLFLSSIINQKYYCILVDRSLFSIDPYEYNKRRI